MNKQLIKWILVFLICSIAAFVFISTKPPQNFDTNTPDPSPIFQKKEQKRPYTQAKNINFQGETNKGNTYVITATGGESTSENSFKVSNPTVTLSQNTQTKFTLKSQIANVNQQTQKIDFPNTMTLKGKDNFTMTTPQSHYDLTTQTLQGSDGIKATSNATVLTGQTYTFNTNNQVMTVSGKARLLMKSERSKK